ncbi:MAG: hypothetical protein AB7H88_11795 [Vicinamibacterales bacterium]
MNGQTHQELANHGLQPTARGRILARASRLKPRRWVASLTAVDELESRLSNWISAYSEAQAHFAAAFPNVAGKIDIQSAALARLGIDDPVELLDRNWTGLELIELLRDVDFKGLSDFEDVSLSEPILPHGTPRRLDEETIKQNGERWRIHANDADPFPASPHAHNLDTGLKLDLRDGNLYRKHALVGRVRPKELFELRSRVKRIQLPPLIDELSGRQDR